MSESNGKALTAEEIFGADDSEMKKVDVPEWGGCVYIKVMTGSDRDMFDKKREDSQPIRAWLLTRCVADENGKPIFTMQDVMRIGAKSGKAIDRIMEKALELNALDSDAAEELSGNLPAAPSGDSGSD